MKRHAQCPLCFDELEAREVAPCHECGCLEGEIEHLKRGVHSYARYRLLGDLELVLCDFCWIDFGSTLPEFLGLPKDRQIQPSELYFLEGLEEPRVTIDAVCPSCNLRGPFLDFVATVRERHRGEASRPR